MSKFQEAYLIVFGFTAGLLAVGLLLSWIVSGPSMFTATKLASFQLPCAIALAIFLGVLAGSSQYKWLKDFDAQWPSTDVKSSLNVKDILIAVVIVGSLCFGIWFIIYWKDGRPLIRVVELANFLVWAGLTFSIMSGILFVFVSLVGWHKK